MALTSIWRIRSRVRPRTPVPSSSRVLGCDTRPFRPSMITHARSGSAPAPTASASAAFRSAGTARASAAISESPFTTTPGTIETPREAQKPDQSTSSPWQNDWSSCTTPQAALPPSRPRASQPARLRNPPSMRSPMVVAPLAPRFSTALRPRWSESIPASRAAVGSAGISAGITRSSPSRPGSVMASGATASGSLDC